MGSVRSRVLTLCVAGVTLIGCAQASTETQTTIDEHRAAEQVGNGSGCLGIGADHSTTYFVDDGPTGGVFDMSFCWVGNAPALADDVHAVATRLTLRPDPTNSRPFPD